MNSSEQNSYIIAIINILKNEIEPENLIPAIYIINELLNKSNYHTQQADLWKEVTSLTYDLGLAPVFRSKDFFFRIYDYIKEDKNHINIDYEILLSFIPYLLRKQSFRFNINEALFEQFNNKLQKIKGHILIAEGEKFVPYLKKMITQNINNFYTVTVSEQFQFEIMKKIFADQHHINIVHSKIYDYTFLNHKFDGIVSVPNIGNTIPAHGNHNFLCRESECIALENLLLHLSLQGKLLILLPPKISFGTRKIKELRNFIQQSYGIEEISELPEGMLSHTQLKTYLYTFNKNIQNEISIKKYNFTETTSYNKEKTPSLKISDETFIMLSELKEQEDWNIDKIFGCQDRDWQKYNNSTIKKVFLKDIANIFRGKAITEKNPNGRIGIINISDIQEYEIVYDKLDHIDDEERKISKYLLQENDLLLPVRGTAIKTAVFHKQAYPCIASANIIVIRPHAQQLSSTYLKIFLDSDIGKKILKSIQQGVSVLNISYKDLQYIEIPCLPYEEQTAIADSYEKGLVQYKEAIKQAQTTWNSVINSLQKKLGN